MKFRKEKSEENIGSENEMISTHIKKETIKQITAQFVKSRVCRIPSLPVSAAAFLAWELRRGFDCSVVMITDSEGSRDEMLRNLAAFKGSREIPLFSYPVLENNSREQGLSSGAGDRIKTLNHLVFNKDSAIIVASEQALTQPAPAPELIRANTLRLVVEKDADFTFILQRLEEVGYKFVPEVHNKGEAAQRGGLLDLWPVAESNPLRVEFFGSIVESIRSFDPADQRSVEKSSEIMIPPADELRLMTANEQKIYSLADYFERESIFFWVDQGPAEIMEIVERNHMIRQCVSGWSLATDVLDNRETFVDPGFCAIPESFKAGEHLFEPDLMVEHRKRLIVDLIEKAREGVSVHLFFDTQGALDRFSELHPKSPFHLHKGILTDGFINEDLRLAAFGEPVITGWRKQTRGRYDSEKERRSKRRRVEGETITDWTGIKPGDLVVHINHGIGRYLGMQEIEFNGQFMETLVTEYAECAKLYVPVAQSHLLSRYVGSGKQQSNLHRLGGTRWQQVKQLAERAVRDMASALLQIQAIRESMEGFAFPPDTEWQHEFENAFPYEETEDQLEAIAKVKADMEAVRPMDRLICGDVGYGKTEVALRAGFKAVTAGKQVALLVPTTVLAQQHFEVFTERMGDYPFNIELLCRFRTHHEQGRAINALAAGSVDIVIGTHRLLQQDVVFKDLGLVIIDEEQRFGVAHKEKLKHIRQLVDVLTLTATPIPRTLYMSLTGARDISMIQTAPQARTPVETIVAPREEQVVRNAIRKELKRSGQVFYLHNRINTIETAREWLQRVVPEARIAVAHGQTNREELSHVMRDFERGAYDILLCTTIIQSGVDIPNVNTIFIDRADRFGVADLYQLRGRVGRSNQKAYAYLLLPPQERVMDESRKRIQAILQHSGLGEGFRLALRDLEIRGAGNLLGHEQSGHIAAVGFELYCQLLKRAVAKLASGEPGRCDLAPIINVEVRLDFITFTTDKSGAESTACLPFDYVEEEQLRLRLYRKIASASELKDIASIREEFNDRFGPIPDALDRLLKIASMRVIAAGKRITEIEAREIKIMLKRDGTYLTMENRFPRFKSDDPDEKLDEITHVLERVSADGKLSCPC